MSQRMMNKKKGVPPSRFAFDLCSAVRLEREPLSASSVPTGENTRWRRYWKREERECKHSHLAWKRCWFHIIRERFFLFLLIMQLEVLVQKRKVRTQFNTSPKAQQHLWSSCHYWCTTGLWLVTRACTHTHTSTHTCTFLYHCKFPFLFYCY